MLYCHISQQIQLSSRCQCPARYFAWRIRIASTKMEVALDVWDQWYMEHFAMLSSTNGDLTSLCLKSFYKETLTVVFRALWWDMQYIYYRFITLCNSVSFFQVVSNLLCLQYTTGSQERYSGYPLKLWRKLNA